MSRVVRVATMAQVYGAPTVEDNIARIAGLVEQALALQPDIVCLPESFALADLRVDDLSLVAQPVPGRILDRFSQYARAGSCYLVCPMLTRRGDVFANEAILIDRQGALVGSYAKVHPVVHGSEFTRLEGGIRPGSDVPVFDTDFGRIGLQICFDIEYPDGWARLKQLGADLVFWPSAYDGGRMLSLRACGQRFFVVSAVQSSRARVLGPLGEVRGQTSASDPVLVTSINLDIGLFHRDFNSVEIPAIRTRYGQAVSIQVWHEENLFTLETNEVGLSVADVIAAFRLDPLDAYVERNRLLQDAWRCGATVPDLTPAYAGRPQWS